MSAATLLRIQGEFEEQIPDIGGDCGAILFLKRLARRLAEDHAEVFFLNVTAGAAWTADEVRQAAAQAVGLHVDRCREVVRPFGASLAIDVSSVIPDAFEARLLALYAATSATASC